MEKAGTKIEDQTADALGLAAAGIHEDKAPAKDATAEANQRPVEAPEAAAQAGHQPLTMLQIGKHTLCVVGSMSTEDTLVIRTDKVQCYVMDSNSLKFLTCI